MTKISLDEVKQLAALAKIAITDKEAEQFRSEIDEILGYVKKLETVDTTGVEPTSQVTGLVNVTRKDEIIDYGVDQAGLLKNVPTTKDNYLRVKRVL